MIRARLIRVFQRIQRDPVSDSTLHRQVTLDPSIVAQSVADRPSSRVEQRCCAAVLRLLRADRRQLPECRHLPAAARHIRDVAASHCTSLPTDL
jgi:hypothetical protein